MLRAAGIRFTIAVSERAGHCRELAARTPSAFTALACAGGDGTVAEVQNGNLSSRNLPLMVIPTGSDNSLAATLGIRTARQAALCMVKGDMIAMDTATLHEIDAAGREGPVLSRPFCLVGWGFLSAVIVDIEKHRWMGPGKTLYCGLKRLCRPLTLYPATISYRPAAQQALQPCQRCNGLDCALCNWQDQRPASALSQEPIKLCAFSRVAGVAIGLHRGKNMAVCDKGAMWPHGVRCDMTQDWIGRQRK